MVEDFQSECERGRRLPCFGPLIAQTRLQF
jgi:hypothetical protein